MRSSSSTSVLTAIILVITFPIWISIAATIFGLIAGLFGIIFGLIGGLFGLVVGIVALPFSIFCGGNDWGWHPFSGFHSNSWLMLAVIALVVIALKRK